MSKIAAIQMTSSADINENLNIASDLIAKAREQGADLILLPENFAFMGMQEQDILKIAEEQGQGKIQNKLKELAKKYHVWIIAGTIPIKTENPNRVRSAMLVYDNNGKQVARYDKMHLFDVEVEDNTKAYLESKYIEPGCDVVVVTTAIGKIGLAVCYDVRFPEMFREMVARGADILVLPAAFTQVTGNAHWHSLLRARAIENLSYVLASAQAGLHQNQRETFGHSMIIDAWGRVLDELPHGRGFVIAEFNQQEQIDIRKRFPVLEHRRL